MENVLVAKNNDVEKKNVNKNKYLFEKCDGTDYAIAVTAGVIAGFVDVIFVGKASKDSSESILGAKIDRLTDNAVINIANFHRKTKGIKGEVNNIASAIRYFEDKYKVNYEHKWTAETGGMVKGLRTTNHHFKSLDHVPDLIGLFFSVMDQFNNTASFMSDGQLIIIDASDRGIRLQGNNLISKIFCGICNWFFHIMSDVAGSTQSRNSLGEGRGTGVTIPGMEFFNLCNFGSFKNGDETNTLAQSMVKVFESGYDLRFGAAMAIPVLLQDLIIRVLWVIRARYDKGREWKECIPNAKHGDLRVMLIVGDATLCVIDGADAAIRSGGNFVEFVLRMNFIAWMRLVKLVLKEVMIRLGADAEDMSEVLARINEDLKEYLYQLRQIDIETFEREARELEELDRKIIMASSEKEITVLLYGEMKRQGITLPFGNHEEFNRFMADDSQKLIL